MNEKIFSVSLCSKAVPETIFVDLPASHYELNDAIDRLRLEDGEEIELWLDSCGKFEEARVYLEDFNIKALNTLAEKLSAMESWRIDAFKGLIKMAMKEEGSNINFQTFMRFADNTDSCQVIYETSDEALGKFYVENGFTPDFEQLPDHVYDFLDYSAIGKKLRRNENGVFEDKAYVVQVSPFTQDKEYRAALPPEPDYIFRVKAGIKIVELPYEDLDAAYVMRFRHPITVMDSAVPYITGSSGYKVPGTHEQNVAWLEQANELAEALVEVREKGLLPTYKALVEAEHCLNFKCAIELASKTHEYTLCRPESSYEEAGAAWIKEHVPDEDVAGPLLKHTNLIMLGKQVFSDVDIAFTEFGMLRHDVQEQTVGEPQMMM